MPRIGTFYQNHLKRKMFNKILFLYTIALIILFVTVAILAYRYYEQRVIQEKMDKNLQTIDIVSVYINQQVERMQSNIQELYTDAAVSEDLNYFLTHDYSTYLEHRLNRYYKNENYQGKGIDTYLKSIVNDDPDAYVAKAMEKFKSAGMDKVIQEAQKQYDEWKKTNK